MAKKEKLDFPFEEIMAATRKIAEEGGTFYQKYSCDKCGERKTMEVANVLYREGACDKCGHVTNIEKKGCNYLLIMSA